MTITRADIVERARRWIGTPYHHQAARRGVGCDCVGLIRGLHADLYGTPLLPAAAYRADWAEVSPRERLMEALSLHLRQCETREPLPGDVLVFRWRTHLPAKHAAVMSASNLMIHVLEGGAVCEVVFAAAWRMRLAACYAFPGLVSE